MANKPQQLEPWKDELIRSIRKEVKDQLYAIEDLEVRLKTAVAAVDKLKDGGSAVGRLKCYVYIMSALVHHDRHGGLREASVKKLVKLAHAILFAQGIDPERSRLAGLLGDLHVIQSHILRRQGDHWLAAWGIEFGERSSGASARGGGGFFDLLLAERSFRLGMTEIAVQSAQKAEEAADRNVTRWRARLIRVTAARLLTNRAQSFELLQEALGWKDLESAYQREFEWERACLEFQKSKSIPELMSLVRRGQPHCVGSYILEAFLWTLCVSGRPDFDALPSLTNLNRRGLLEPLDHEILYECCNVIRDCYNPDISMLRRLESLGEMLLLVRRVSNIDRELLLWLAAARWLSKTKASRHFALVLAEYQGLSLRLSNGAIKDALGLASDL